MQRPDTPHELTPGADAHRREHVRHAVSVPAVLESPRTTPLRCEIRDLSSTGMYLGIGLRVPRVGPDPLAEGSDLRLRLAPDPGAPDAYVPFDVHVMWRTSSALGVSFGELDATQRSALRRIAQLAVRERAHGGEPEGQLPRGERRRIAAACRRVIEKHLPNMIWSVRTDLARRLRRLAIENPAEAGAARRDADRVDQSANAIALTVERQFLQCFAEACDLDETQEMSVALLAAASAAGGEDKPVSLMGEDASDRIAAITAIAQTAAERYKTPLFELNLRLKDVVGRRMDGDGNPLNPLPACHLLWSCVVEYCDSPLVRRGLCDVIRVRVVPLLGDLYADLHAALDAEGVPAAFD